MIALIVKKLKKKKWNTALFFLLLVFALQALIFSGVFGGLYQFNAITERNDPFIDRILLSISSALFLASIAFNPFYSFWERQEDRIIFDITGLEVYHWVQARDIVEKYGQDAIVKLALRASDDFLTDRDREDFRKSRFAAEIILKAKEQHE